MFPLQPELAATGTAWIASEVLEFLRREADSAAPLETGGVLLGYWSEAPTSPVVTHALGPGPNAIHEQNRFVPDYDFHEREIARLYRAADSALAYLGDWHSHPRSPGYLSKSDCATLCRIASSRAARAPRPLMIILAFGPEWEPVVWAARTKRTLLRRKFTIERWNPLAFPRA